MNRGNTANLDGVCVLGILQDVRLQGLAVPSWVDGSINPLAKKAPRSGFLGLGKLIDSRCFVSMDTMAQWACGNVVSDAPVSGEALFATGNSGIEAPPIGSGLASVSMGDIGTFNPGGIGSGGGQLEIA